jgi:hypothetical protein
MKAIVKKLIMVERGQVLPTVLILLLAGVLIITPALALAGTSIKTGKLFKDYSVQYYAADAGMEEAVKEIREKYPDVYTENIFTEFSLNNNDVDVTFGSTGYPKTYSVISTATDNSGKSTTIKSFVRGNLCLIDYAATSLNEIVKGGGGSAEAEIYGPTYPYYPEEDWPTESEILEFYKLITPYPRTMKMIANSDDSNTGGFIITPNLWSKIDETTADDTDFITGVTDSGGRATFGYEFEYEDNDPSFTWPSDVYISSISVTYRVKSAGQTTNKIGACIKVGGHYYYGSLNNPPKSNQSIGEFTEYFYMNSDTSPLRQWEIDDLTNPGSSHYLSAFGIYSNDFNPDVNVYMVYAQVNYTTMEPGIESSPFTFNDDSTIESSYIPGGLDILCTSSSMPIPTLTLDGTIYTTGDINIGTTNQDFIMNLNDNAIFTESTNVGTGLGQCAINIGGKCTLTGSGCIVALGDVYFQPKIQSTEGDFIFVCSLYGTVHFGPVGDFYGSIAGNINVELWSGNTLTWNQYPTDWEVPFPLDEKKNAPLKYLNWTIIRN